jgi:ATP-dependent protease ClpP protease subunit
MDQETLLRLHALAGRARRIGSRPAAGGPWFSISNETGDRAKLMIYGVIGSDWDEGDVTAAGFSRALDSITAPVIDLHLNSPGGLVFDGVAIYTALVAHASRVEAHVDGLAASAASFVAMAGDLVEIAKPAKMMIHDARGLTLGGPAEHREMADLLDELSDTIAGIYADRAGGTVAGWREAMTATTWYSAESAVKAGLADQVTGKAPAPDNRTRMIRARHRVRVGTERV